MNTKPATPLTDALSFSRAISKLAIKEHWQQYAAVMLKHARRLERERAQLVEALRGLLVASDRFVQDTGLKHGDLITDRADEARVLLRSLGEEA